MHHEEIILSCIIELNLKTIYSLEENILHQYSSSLSYCAVRFSCCGMSTCIHLFLNQNNFTFVRNSVEKEMFRMDFGFLKIHIYKE